MVAKPTQLDKPERKSSNSELTERVRAKLNELVPKLFEQFEDDLRQILEAGVSLLSEFDIFGCRVSVFLQPIVLKYKLTKQQVRVSLLASQCIRNKEIAEKLGLSPNTVASHLQRIYRELNVKNKVELSRKLLVLSKVIK